jgi:uncharacterized membrane protein YagU involved in acid resistance
MANIGDRRASTILKSFLWLIANGALIISMLMLDMNWNMFDWHGPELDGWAILFFSIILTFSFVLIKMSSKILSLGQANVYSIAAVITFGLGVMIVFGQDKPSEGLLGRDEMPPLWYNLFFIFIHAIPLFSYLYFQKIKGLSRLGKEKS